jgi:hypothetical protein
MKKSLINLSIAFISALAFSSCDEHTPPKLEFKVGPGLLSSDDTAATMNTKYAVGIIASKTEDDIKTYNISVAYNGANSMTVKTTNVGNHVDRIDTIMTRNTVGIEKWSFTITDQDGNIATKSIHLKVK